MICTDAGGALKPVDRLANPLPRRSFRLRPPSSIFASELCAPRSADRRPALTADRPLRIRLVQLRPLPQIRNRTTTAAPRSALERGRVDCLQSLHSRADPDKYPLLARPQTVMSMTEHRPLRPSLPPPSTTPSRLCDPPLLYAMLSAVDHPDNHQLRVHVVRKQWRLPPYTARDREREMRLHRARACTSQMTEGAVARARNT